MTPDDLPGAQSVASRGSTDPSGRASLVPGGSDGSAIPFTDGRARGHDRHATFGEEHRRESCCPIDSSGLPFGGPCPRLSPSPLGVEEWDPLGKSSYAVVRRLVVVQLKVGVSAVVDAVNPFETIRSDYQELAHDQQTDCVLVHTVCTDEHLHRRRVEARHAGGKPVDWAEIERQAGYYEDPDHPDVTVDAANPLDRNVAMCWGTFGRGSADEEPSFRTVCASLRRSP